MDRESMNRDMTEGTRQGFLIARIRGALLFGLAMLAVLGIGIANDHRSCTRQVPIREQGNIRQLVERDFLVTAAIGRLQSAHHERRGNPYQARIDELLAKHWEREAKLLHGLPIPDCNNFLPPA